MARPRIFVSSTYYDLKHIRSSLENFIDSMGFESILSEKGQIAYSPEIPLDESCYREVGNSDIFIIIIGGRYGSEKSEKRDEKDKDFFDRYDSITKQEYKSAVERDVPSYILIEKSVYSEHEIFLKNKNNESINYVHVDSVNIFHLIEDILSQPRNNPVHQFDRYSDIEAWLKEQWAGLFRELLNQRSKQTQIASLTSQVNTLGEINRTLKRYLEEVVSKVSPEDSTKLIEDESKRLKKAKQFALLKENILVKFLENKHDILAEDYYDTLIKSKTFNIFTNKVSKLSKGDRDKLHAFLIDSDGARQDVNKTREIIGLNPFK